MRIRYTPPNDLCISGSVAELQAVRGQLLQLAQDPGAPDTVRLDLPTDGDPTPYAQWLGELLIASGVGPVRVAVIEERRLEIIAAPELLAVFASFWDFAPDSASGLHNHHEYDDGSETIAPDSLPLVIQVE